MLKIVVLAAVAVFAVKADDAGSFPAPPTPDPSACKAEYLKDANLCGNIPEIIDESAFKTCAKKGEEMAEGKFGPGGDSDKRSGASAGPLGKAGSIKGKANGGGEASKPPKKGGNKKQRNRRDVGGRGGKERKGGQGKPDFGGKGRPDFKGGPPGFKGPHGPPGPGCINCMVECVFNTSGLLDTSGAVDINAVKTKFSDKAANDAWKQIISTNVDSCWTDAQNAPAPTTPAPPAGFSPPPGLPPRKECKHQPAYLLQCVQRALAINIPDADRTNKVNDCDARIASLKSCNPMVPVWVDFKKMDKDDGSSGSHEEGEGGDAPSVSPSKKSAPVKKEGKRPDLKKKGKTTAAP